MSVSLERLIEVVSAQKLANSFSTTVLAQPYGHGSFLNATERSLKPTEIVITNYDAPNGNLLAQVARQKAPPTATLLLIGKDQSLPLDHPAGGKTIGQTPQAFLCTQGTCTPPINTAEILRQELVRTYRSLI